MQLSGCDPIGRRACDATSKLHTLDDVDVERGVVLPAAPDAVWEALTGAEALDRWFGASADLDPRPGRTSVFRHPDGTEERAMVESAEPGRRLVLRWLPFARDPDGRTRHRVPTRVTFALEPNDGGTELRVTEERIDASGPRLPDLRLEGARRR